MCVCGGGGGTWACARRLRSGQEGDHKLDHKDSKE